MTAAATAAKLRQALKAIKAYKRHKFETFRPYEWQRDVYAAGKKYIHRLIVAGNRVGKTDGMCYEVAAHARGDYPDDWQGFQFSFAPVIWCCGVSGEQLRDVFQRKLLGDLGDKGFEGGLIPPDRILEVTRDTGTPKLAKDVRIKHRFGTTLLSFKSYTQGTKPLMGSNIDLGCIDEQPPDEAYTQILTRTALGNRGKGGLLLMGFTAELGWTETLQSWVDKPTPYQFLKYVTWDDSPHLTPEIQEQLLEAYPEDERDMRRAGLPMHGEGPVFSAMPEDYIIEPFVIPPHYRVVAAIDFGISHRFACVWTAQDPATKVKYVFAEYASRNSLPPVHVAAIHKQGAKIPIVYPHDGHIREKGSGVRLADTYRGHGARMITHFLNPDNTIHIIPGVRQMNLELNTGMLKIFRSCADTIREMAIYHKDRTGAPVAKNDDLMSAMRYSTCSVERINDLYAHAFGSSQPAKDRRQRALRLQPDY